MYRKNSRPTSSPGSLVVAKLVNFPTVIPRKVSPDRKRAREKTGRETTRNPSDQTRLKRDQGGKKPYQVTISRSFPKGDDSV